MSKTSLIKIISGLNDGNIKYLIAGGLAVVYHGYLRFTSDLDLIISLERENISKAINILKNLGYLPRVPVNPEDIAVEEIRLKWINEKGMIAFSMFNQDMLETPVDIIIQIPFNFDEEYWLAAMEEIEPGIIAPFISLEQLINLKRISNRDIDKSDILNLEMIHKS